MERALGWDLRAGARKMAWWLALRGLLAVAFGVLFLARPRVGLAVLVATFGVYALLDGVTSAVAAFRIDCPPRGRALLALEALVGIVAGVLAFARPGVAALAVLVIIAVRALVVGMLQVTEAVGFGRRVPGFWLLLLGGFASLVFGALLLARPGTGLLAVVWFIGYYAILIGLLSLGASLTVGGAVSRAERDLRAS
jgi:uncharacterized membrane protein HdeD (DUF308 family)